MSHQGLSPLPPTSIHSIIPISQSAAHDFLAAYLDRATTDPALQPNAAISEHGPVSRTTAAAPNLILHNLKRVQAGLAGEVLGRDLSLIDVLGGGGEEGEEQQDGQDYQQQQQHGKGKGQQRRDKGAGAGEWQDAEEWQQTNTGVTTTPIAGGEEDDDEGGEEDDGYGETKLQIRKEDGDTTILGGDGGVTSIDKEERKRKKKERRLAEKRAKTKKSA